MVAKNLEQNLARKSDELGRLWYKFSRNKLSVLGLIIVLLIIISAILAPYIVPYPKHYGAFVDFKHVSLPPGGEYWFGTDQFGRDIFSRTIYALRGALVIGIGVIGLAAPIGVVLGLIAGYYANTWRETLIMRIVDIFLSLPPLVLALVASSVVKPTLFNSMMAICLAWWAWYARITYGMASSLRNEFYIQSAKLIGASPWHILIKELLPNCLNTILTKMTLDMGWVILIGASLSFVGLGEQPPKPALGTMVADGARYLPHMWWLTIFPAVAIMFIVLSFNLLGDGIGDMLGVEEV